MIVGGRAQVEYIKLWRGYVLSLIVVIILITIAVVDTNNHSDLVNVGSYRVRIIEESKLVSITKLNHGSPAKVYVNSTDNIINNSIVLVSVKEADFRSIHFGDEYVGRSENRLEIRGKEEYRSVFLWPVMLVVVARILADIYAISKV